MPRTSETVFNSELAKALRQMHPRWAANIGAEQTNVFHRAAGLRPDIVVHHQGGLSVVVETEYTPAQNVEDEARERLGETLEETGDDIEQAFAVRIPRELAEVGQDRLAEAIKEAALELCLFSGEPEDPQRWPETGWFGGSVKDLARFIELAAVSERRIAQGLQILEAGVGQAAGKLRWECTYYPNTLNRIAEDLHQRDSVQTSRMAMAILANALTFHTVIAGEYKIESLDELKDELGRSSRSMYLTAWKNILENINYWPIFKIAMDILLSIREATAKVLLERLANVANTLAGIGVTSQHDLCGRMFQRLITDRKFLATFYTLPSSATLLAELAVTRLEIDWSQKSEVSALRIGDFACGTGALLNAAYESILSRFRREGGDDECIHPDMMENALVGADIMPAATHLTASVLSSAHPTVTFRNTSIFTLPYGQQPDGSGRQIAIGALDLIEDQETMPLFGTGRIRLIGQVRNDRSEVPLPHVGFDLVIMNPPFTRPTNHEAAEVPVPSFAGFETSDDEQRHMSDRLREIRKVGHGNAGLASNFVDLAHAKVKEGGVLALVLPAAFLQGKGWEGARQLFDSAYRDVVVVSIAATGSTDRAFSADTGMAEVLVIATKKKKDAIESDKPQPTLFANISRRPPSIVDAAATALAIHRTPPNPDTGAITIGADQNNGCTIWGMLGEGGCAGVREAGIANTARGLLEGELRLPRGTERRNLPITRLEALGKRGLLHRDINGKYPDGEIRGAFDIAPIRSGQFPEYPALWAHRAKREKYLIVAPDTAASARPGCEDRAAKDWRKTASRLHFTLDFRINSQPLAACLTPEKSIGGTAWPNFVCSQSEWETPLVLWSNTTLGLIAFWWLGSRQHQGRTRLTISRVTKLPVLDPRKLDAEQVERAQHIFKTICQEPMLPANEAWRDENRQRLDRKVLVDLLNLPEEVMEPLSLLRLQWCAEPSVHGGKGTAPERT